MNAFLCHSCEDTAFVLEVASHLRRHLDIPFELFTYEDPQQSGVDYVSNLDERLRNATHFIVFAGRKFSRWQTKEVNAWVRLEAGRKRGRKSVVVAISGQLKPQQLPRELSQFVRGDVFLPDTYRIGPVRRSFKCACDIVLSLGIPWRGADGLPYNPHLFDFEKRVIDFFLLKAGANLSVLPKNESEAEKSAIIQQRLFDGGLNVWPEPRMLEGDLGPNRLPGSLAGVFRPHDSKVVASALTRLERSGI
jgi:hypothetical protein